MDISDNRRIAAGKTKILYRHNNIPHMIMMVSKDSVTAFNGDKHDEIQGKSLWATRAAANLFTLLKRNGLPVAFAGSQDNILFAKRCQMFPFEVVVRNIAFGSFPTRFNCRPLSRLRRPIVEFFLKTTNRQWGSNINLPVDDPWIAKHTEAVLTLARPDVPAEDNTAIICTVSKYRPSDDFPRSWEHRDLMEKIAEKALNVLKTAFSEQGCTLIDFKIEFGETVDGEIVIADVIDADSCRVIDNNGKHLSKEIYRQGESLEFVARMYEQFAKCTSEMVS